jgi:hypothetical protein
MEYVIFSLSVFSLFVMSKYKKDTQLLSVKNEILKKENYELRQLCPNLPEDKKKKFDAYEELAEKY